MVSAYLDELVAYDCRDAAVRSAELSDRRRACIVTIKVSRRHSCRDKRDTQGC